MATSQFVFRNIPITVVRRKVRHCYLGVYPPQGEVRVTCSPRYSETEILSFLSKKHLWIEKQLSKFRVQENRALDEMECETGDSVFFLGEKHTLGVLLSKRPAIFHNSERREITIALPDTQSKRAKHALLRAWYREQLQNLVPEMLRRWSTQLGVAPNSWTLRKMKRRWGTCFTHSRHIVLSESLARYSKECIEYVVVHELIHLHVPNHGPKFKRMLHHALPHWKELKAQLES